MPAELPPDAPSPARIRVAAESGPAARADGQIEHAPSRPDPHASDDAPTFAYPSEELDALVGARNYYDWIMHWFRPHLGPRVVEVGAGIGTFSALLLRERVVERLTLFEPAANNCRLLRARFADDPRVEVRHAYYGADAADASADTIALVNVLEHIEADVEFLVSAYRSLAAGGRLLLFVPALPALYGTLDEAFGHFRRYTKPMLDLRLRQAGFESIRLRYFNAAGVVPWFVTGRVLRRRTLDATAVELYDRMVVPWVSSLERRWEPPVAQSLLAIASRAPEKRRRDVAD